MSKTKLYKNEEQNTYKILSFMTVFVTAEKKESGKEAKYISDYIFLKDTSSL